MPGKVPKLPIIGRIFDTIPAGISARAKTNMEWHVDPAGAPE